MGKLLSGSNFTWQDGPTGYKFDGKPQSPKPVGRVVAAANQTARLPHKLADAVELVRLQTLGWCR